MLPLDSYRLFTVSWWQVVRRTRNRNPLTPYEEPMKLPYEQQAKERKAAYYFDQIGPEFDQERSGFRLQMCYAGSWWVGGQCRTYAAYRLFHEGRLVFEGCDYSPAPALDHDSDEAAGGLLGFLSLKPGDTDEEYFERNGYTPEQLDFAIAYGEELSLWGMELEGTLTD